MSDVTILKRTRQQGRLLHVGQRLTCNESDARLLVGLRIAAYVDDHSDASLDNYAHMDDWYTENEFALYREIGELMIERFHPQSLLDVGCGEGHFMLPFIAAGIHTAGVDGEPTFGKKIADYMTHVDLRTEWRGDQQYEMVSCIEVAEHLDQRYAPKLIADLCAMQPSVVVFSAANAGQGGWYHKNCQVFSYWASLFREHGYTVIDDNGDIQSAIADIVNRYNVGMMHLSINMHVMVPLCVS